MGALDTRVARAAAARASVDIRTGYEITDDDPWWFPEAERVPAPVAGAPLAWKYSAPRVEPALFLPFLARGLSLEQRVVDDLEREPGDVVVDRGLGSGDCEPLFGQVVITEPGDVDLTITDETSDLFYVSPRCSELVLGGCALPRAALEPDPAITARILDRARALGLRVGATKHVRTGLRPYRATMRLERTGRVIRNYGHGGAGYTCAAVAPRTWRRYLM